MSLDIKDLHVSVDGKEILKGINLSIENGSVHALMGPNGSGKSTLAYALLGHPKYVITKGKIVLDGEDITHAKPNERAKKGLFLSFQYPQELSGVTVSNFLRTAYGAVKGKKPSILEFKKVLETNMRLLGMDPAFTTRYLNEGFSGGEKKRAEILQMLVLDPAMVVLDETDSGLDIDALRIVSEGVNTFMKANKKKAVLVITHYRRILDYLTPDKLSIIMDGKIVLEGKGKLVDELEAKGYSFLSEKE